MYCDFEDFLDVIKIFVVFLLTIVGIMFGVAYGISFVAYKNDISQVTVMLDDNVVYSGNHHNITYVQLGENGNVYKLDIYNDIFNDVFFGKRIKTYTGKNLRIEGKKW